MSWAELLTKGPCIQMADWDSTWRLCNAAGAGASTGLQAARLRAAGSVPPVAHGPSSAGLQVWRVTGRRRGSRKRHWALRDAPGCPPSLGLPGAMQLVNMRCCYRGCGILRQRFLLVFFIFARTRPQQAGRRSSSNSRQLPKRRGRHRALKMAAKTLHSTRRGPPLPSLPCPPGGARATAERR